MNMTEIHDYNEVVSEMIREKNKRIEKEKARLKEERAKKSRENKSKRTHRN